MLNFFRKKTKVIIWAIVVSFIGWGGYSTSIQFEDVNRAAGRIFGKEVSFRDYGLAQHAVQLFRPVSDEKEPPNPEVIEARTWEFLIFSREAKKRRVPVSDEEVREEIRRLLTANQEAPFTREEYDRWVRTVIRQEPREFEGEVREHLRIRKLFDGVRKEFKEQPEENLNRWAQDLITSAKVQVYRNPSPAQAEPKRVHPT